MKKYSLRTQVFLIIHDKHPNKRVELTFRIFITVLIFLSIVSIMLATVQDFRDEYYDYLHGCEIFTVCVFTLEYILGLWSAVEDEKYRQPFWGRLRYMSSWLALIDLLAILPFYFRTFTSVDLRFIRVVRLLRIFRLMQLPAYAKSLSMILRVLRKRRTDLITAFFLIAVVLIITSSIMFYVEHDAQPKVFSSIPATMWWGVVTLTTTGYGDIVPITTIGKIVGSIISISCIGFLTLPAAIFTVGFFDEIQSTNKKSHHEIISQLERLAELREKNALTEEEFQKQKEKILS